MSLDEIKTSLRDILRRNVRVDFRSFLPDRNYELIIPFALQQISKNKDDVKLALTGNNKPKWYIGIYCYFTQDCEVKVPESPLPFWIKQNELVRVNFRGYGFYDQLKHCEDKDIADIKRIEDGVKVIFRRNTNKKNKKRVNSYWDMLQVKIVNYEDMPLEIREAGVLR